MSPPASPALSPPPAPAPSFAVAFSALVVGAVAMGVSPVFVRFAEVGPFTSAFWRVALSLPFLYLWARLEADRQKKRTGIAPEATPWTRAQVLAGLFFTGDLIFWHLSILNTTIANATFLATMAPVWVVLGSGLFIGEAVSRASLAGLALCLAGAGTLVGSSYSFAPDRLTGDLFGICTSLFFGLYFLAVRAARRSAPTGVIMFRSSIVTALCLFGFAAFMEGSFLPQTVVGLSALLALALMAHVGGQGLLAYALGHLSAVFSSLVIFMEAMTAGVVGWIVLSEALSPLQIAGGAAIVAGIWVARPRH